MKIKDFKTARDLFAKTYNRPMFSFVDFGEISRMKKVVQVRQTQQKERNKNDHWPRTVYTHFGFNSFNNNVFVFRLTITMKGKKRWT